MSTSTEPSPRRFWASVVLGIVAVVAVSVVLGATHRSPKIVADDALHVRHRDHGDKHLKAEDRPSALDEPVNTSAPPSEKRTRVVAAPVDAASDDPTADAYESAVEAYRAKRWSDAAAELEAFVNVHPDAREAEDAFFLQASALAHAGDRDAAAEVADRFLARYPGSFHAPDAAILVARSARDRGDCARAREVLAPWQVSRPVESEAALGACR